MHTLKTIFCFVRIKLICNSFYLVIDRDNRKIVKVIKMKINKNKSKFNNYIFNCITIFINSILNGHIFFNNTCRQNKINKLKKLPLPSKQCVNCIDLKFLNLNWHPCCGNTYHFHKKQLCNTNKLWKIVILIYNAR